MTNEITINKAQASIIKKIKPIVESKVMGCIQHVLYEAMCASDGEAMDSKDVETATLSTILNILEDVIEGSIQVVIVEEKADDQ